MQSIEDIPQWFADYFNLSLEASQVILSIIVILSVLLPTMYLSRGSKSVIVEVVLLFLCEVALVGIGWLPFWVLIATIAVASMAVAYFGTGIVTGRG